MNPWHLRRAIRITWCITGHPALIYSALSTPHGDWWQLKAGKAWLGPLTRPWEHWQPWRKRSTSWQAAYNTACLYAALADAARRCHAPVEVLRELEQRVITSLRRVVDNPQSELERAWDWIYGDPDFRVMRDDWAKYPEFGKFLKELEQQEYPASMRGKCPVPHAKPPAAGWDARAEPPIFSPVPSPVPLGNDDSGLAHALSAMIH